MSDSVPVGVAEFRLNFAEYARRAHEGERFVITRNGRPDLLVGRFLERTPMTTEPWGFFGDPASIGLAAGWVLQAQRAERAEAAEEKLKQAEAQEKADERIALATWQARQSALMRGLPWDERRPFQYELTPVQKADMLFAAQDAEAARRERAALIEAGPLTTMPPRVEDAPDPAGTGSADGTGASRGMSRPAVTARLSRALTRWSKRPVAETLRGLLDLDGMQRAAIVAMAEYDEGVDR